MSSDNHVWGVDVTLPQSETRRWVENRRFTVVCRTAERAIELVREHRGDCTIIAIHRVGRDASSMIVDGQDAGTAAEGGGR